MKKYLYPETEVKFVEVSQNILISPSIGGGVSGGDSSGYPESGSGGDL